MISLENVSVVYPGAAAPALRNVSVDFRAGEVAVLLGASGAGKSTLLRVLNGLVAPSSGRVQVDRLGDLLDPERLRAHRRRTGMIFQSHQLIGRLSALANVLQGRLGYQSTFRSLFPAAESDLRLALRCLARVGLLDRAADRADRLSGGERQRVGIARALAQEASLLLADEPVASLDPAHGERILADLQRICREDALGAVVSLHQVAFARSVADRILGLRAGRIVFDGAPADLNSDVLLDLYGFPMSDESLKEAL